MTYSLKWLFVLVLVASVAISWWIAYKTGGRVERAEILDEFRQISDKQLLLEEHFRDHEQRLQAAESGR